MQLALLNKIKKYYGDKLILDIDKFEILDGDKIGLVGDNGAGKTTLLKILIGDEPSDEGTSYLTKSYSYISQFGNSSNECSFSKIKSIFNAPTEYKDYLSGGEKVKMKIANALSENKKLIIADEPTSNLDSNSVETLEDMLKNYSGALLLVSHDRNLLDSLCNTIVEIKDGKINIYNGNYSKYIELKKAEKARGNTEYNQYINEKRRLEEAIVSKENIRDGIRRTPKRMGNSEARLHKMGGQKCKKKLENNIKAIQNRIEQLDVKEKPKEDKDIKIYVIENLELTSKNPIEAKNLTITIGNKILLNESSFKIKKGKKVALIGKNGSGKSTLLKEIINNNNENMNLINWNSNENDVEFREILRRIFACYNGGPSYGMSVDLDNAQHNYPNKVFKYAMEFRDGGLTGSGTPVDNEIIEKAIEAGMKWVGKSPYVWGGGRTQADVDAGRFDCSSFVHYMYASAGIQLGDRSSVVTFSLVNMGQKINPKDMKRGDIIFFDTYTIDGHVGVYLGGGKFIHDGPTNGVEVTDINLPYWQQTFNGKVRGVVN